MVQLHKHIYKLIGNQVSTSQYKLFTEMAEKIERLNCIFKEELITINDQGVLHSYEKFSPIFVFGTIEMMKQS